jgi:hypothetical protein
MLKHQRERADFWTLSLILMGLVRRGKEAGDTSLDAPGLERRTGGGIISSLDGISMMIETKMEKSNKLMMM